MPRDPCVCEGRCGAAPCADAVARTSGASRAAVGGAGGPAESVAAQDAHVRRRGVGTGRFVAADGALHEAAAFADLAVSNAEGHPSVMAPGVEVSAFLGRAGSPDVSIVVAARFS